MKLILVLLMLGCAMAQARGKNRRVADSSYSCTYATNDVNLDVMADAADNKPLACSQTGTTTTILRKNFPWVYAAKLTNSPILSGANLCEKKNHYCNSNPTSSFSYSNAVIFNWPRDANRQVWIGDGKCATYDASGVPQLATCTTAPHAYQLTTLTYDRYKSLPLLNRCAGTFVNGEVINGRNCTGHIWQPYQWPIGVGQFWTHWLYNFKKADGTANAATTSVIPTSTTTSTGIAAVTGNQWMYGYLVQNGDPCTNTVPRREDESPEEHMQRVQDIWDFITLTAKSTVETIYDEEEYAKRDVENPARKEYVKHLTSNNKQLAAMCYIDQELASEQVDEDAVEAFGQGVPLNSRVAIICLVKTVVESSNDDNGDAVYNAVTSLISAIYAESKCIGGPNGKIWEKATEVLALKALGYELAHPIMQCSCVAAHNVDANHPSMNGKTADEIEALRQTLCAGDSFGLQHPL